MHVNGKKIAFSGVLMALTVLLIVMGGIFQFNTLFLLGAAAFFVGVIIREYGVSLGAAFYVGCVVLGYILSPDKLQMITFGAMGLYLLLTETVWLRIMKRSPGPNTRKIFWAAKYLIFNLLFIPMVIFFPRLLFAGGIEGWFLAAVLLGGQVILFIYDKAYDYFQVHIWNKYRKVLGF